MVFTIGVHVLDLVLVVNLCRDRPPPVGTSLQRHAQSHRIRKPLPHVAPSFDPVVVSPHDRNAVPDQRLRAHLAGPFGQREDVWRSDRVSDLLVCHLLDLVRQRGVAHPGTIELSVEPQHAVVVNTDPIHRARGRFSIVETPECPAGRWLAGEAVDVPPKLVEELAGEDIPVTVKPGAAEILILYPLQVSHVFRISRHQNRVIVDLGWDEHVLVRQFVAQEVPVDPQTLHPCMSNTAGVARKEHTGPHPGSGGPQRRPQTVEPILLPLGEFVDGNVVILVALIAKDVRIILAVAQDQDAAVGKSQFVLLRIVRVTFPR